MENGMRIITYKESLLFFTTKILFGINICGLLIQYIAWPLLSFGVGYFEHRLFVTITAFAIIITIYIFNFIYIGIAVLTYFRRGKLEDPTAAQNEWIFPNFAHYCDQVISNEEYRLERLNNPVAMSLSILAMVEYTVICFLLIYFYDYVP